jgi:hypothetical protein
MYCPKCRAEYLPHHTECTDCGVKLQAGQPPPAPPHHSIFDSDDVTLIVTANAETIRKTKLALETARIGYYTTGDDADVAKVPRAPGGGYHGVSYIKINKADAEAAVAALRNAGISETD